MEVIRQQINTDTILDQLTQHPEQTDEILSALDPLAARYLKRRIALNIIAITDQNYVRAADLPSNLMGFLTCWCCGNPLNECHSLLEDGFTTLQVPPDPDLIERAAETGLAQVDGSGRGLYIPLCGQNGYD